MICCNPKSIKLELVTLIVFSVILVSVTVVPIFNGLPYIGLPLAIIAASFGIPGAKLPHRAYAITAATFGCLSALCFIISTCLYIYALCAYDVNLTSENSVYVNTVSVLVAISMAVLMFCTVTSCALAVKTIHTALNNRFSSISESGLTSRSAIVVLSPTEDSYLKMPPPLPIGEEMAINSHELPPPYTPDMDKV